MLRNDLYRGVLVYGRTERIYRAGKRSQRRRDPSQWLRREAPEVRIVAEELWRRAHACMTKKAEAFKRAASGTLIGRPPGTRTSRYLLSGLAQCGVCEGSIFAYAQNHHAGARVGWYRCHLHATRGADICTNQVRVSMRAVDTLVLDAIERQVLDAAALDACLDEAVKLWEAEQTPAAAARAAVKTELRRVETEIAALEQQLVSGAPWTLIAEPMATRK